MITRFLDALDRAATRGRFHAVLLGTCAVMAGGLAAVAGMVLLSLVVGTMAGFGISGSVLPVTATVVALLWWRWRRRPG